MFNQLLGRKQLPADVEDRGPLKTLDTVRVTAHLYGDFISEGAVVEGRRRCPWRLNTKKFGAGHGWSPAEKLVLVAASILLRHAAANSAEIKVRRPALKKRVLALYEANCRGDLC